MTFKGCGALVNGGIQVGGGSVTIFLLVSAWLYGSKWHKDGFKSFDTFEFLKKKMSENILAIVDITPWGHSLRILHCW